MALGRRVVFRSGFGIVIGLLVASTIMAWRIQVSFSEQSVSIHRRFVREQEVLTQLRRVLWTAGALIRDQFLDPQPNEQELGRQLGELKADSVRLISVLKSTSARVEAVTALEWHLIELWQTLEKGALLPDDQTARFAFIQQEVLPRRSEADRLLRNIEQANHSSLAEGETEFTATRTSATHRLLIVLGVCLLFGVVVAHLSVSYSDRLEKEASDRFVEVSEAKLQLEHLSARLMEVQEEERTKLSRELHDEIVQNLAVLKMEIIQAQTLATKDPGALREPLSRARKLAETTVQTVRNISLLLRPSLLDDLGLGPALQWQAEEFCRRTGTSCVIEGDVSEDLPDTVKTCVYRVTQEALRNCEKHSGATRVTVELRESENSLEVTVTDNGRGFPPQAVRNPSSLGVLGMKERAAMLGGTLSAANGPQGGAVIRLVVPCSSAARKKQLMAHVQV